jgi:acyl transferase domain-containing protein
MESTAHRAIAIVGLGTILPEAPDVKTFWSNIQQGRDSISEVPNDRWNPEFYYDPDPAAPDKTYSKIGGWVRDFPWDPIKWRLPIPPKVSDAMDASQRWAIAGVREALADYGYPERAIATERTAVILGNAMGGERHYLTALRISFPEYAHALETVTSFAALPADIRDQITEELHERMGRRLPEITEDSMPGELANCIAGRIANLYNFHGPNFVVDAACASAMGAMSAAVQGLNENQFDVVVTGGIDRNMGATTFVKFSKIGALSATGSRPYAAGADGFVMGEGAVIFLLKRLADAERDGDKVYAVLRGIGGSSDGKGKGITAPNPIGQVLCTKRAWENAGLSPSDVNYIEGHGTSTRVGDVVEVQSMMNVLSEHPLPAHSIPIGSVKSNIGHLKAAAGAAGILKTVLALHNKVLPPSVHCERPSPDIDFAHSPLFVNTELRPWEATRDSVRRAGVSAFGFGGTNFHTVLEEYVPGRLQPKLRERVTVSEIPQNAAAVVAAGAPQNGLKAPLRGALVLGASSEAELAGRLRSAKPQATHKPPLESDLRSRYRIAFDYGSDAEFEQKKSAALKALDARQPAIWKALRAQGIFRGSGPAPKIAFLYTGQGSQYVNMFKALRSTEPIVAETFAQADHIMTPLLGKPLSEYIFVDSNDEAAIATAEEDLRQTAITQPAVLSVDIATTRLLAAYGIQPDMTMGHSLGEYGALVASGSLPFEEALEAVSARGREMTRVSMADNGKMAAVFAPLAAMQQVLKTVSGYVEIANINSDQQAVIGGASAAVAEASEKLLAAGFNVVPLPVSHAFHTSIVAPASGPLRATLERMHLQAPRIPIVANVNGEFYPTDGNVVPQMLDILARQISSPVQFVQGLRTLYNAGARVFVEVGPKKALQGFAEDVLGKDPEVLSVFCNHPKWEDQAAFNQALCGLYSAGLGSGTPESVPFSTQPSTIETASTAREESNMSASVSSDDRYTRIGRMFVDFLDRAGEMEGREPKTAEPVVITGGALGLPGTEHIFDDNNIARLLRGEQFIDVIPKRFRHAMVDRHIRRLVKRENGDPTFESIEDVSEAIKLAGRGGAFDLEHEFGVAAERVAAFDRTTALALAAGIDALRDAGIPLVMRYKTTTVGTRLPDRLALPASMRDDTGVIFASAFPGSDSLTEIMSGYYDDHLRREQLKQLQELRAQSTPNGHNGLAQEIERRIAEIQSALEQHPYTFERRFLLRVLSMGHSQLAEYIGARGPNTQINSACASTTLAVGMAEDWIRLGRCRRVLIVAADDVTSDNLLPWFGSGFLASGVAATDDSVEKAALPFDRRRHGMIIGMGAAGLVVESADSARERGIRPICEVLATVIANSAFHATRLDVQHIGDVMESLVKRAENSRGIRRSQISSQMVFVSHETYTPARGGSASAEIHALRKVFGDDADKIVIANTKGFTGHAMATGIEDVLAVKALETGVVPPVANIKEIDPELGPLNISHGGSYPVQFALRLGAGFGSQISMSLLRWVPSKDGRRTVPSALGYQNRIADEGVWSKWLAAAAEVPAPELEIVHRTLRVRNTDARVAVASTPVKQAAVPAIPQVQPVAVAQPAVVSQPVPASTASQADAVREKVLQLVAEKTGYPADMLALDLDLEADLGVDTVKQAEVFASIRAEYNIPRSETLRLRDFPTLAHVIKFVYDNRPDLSGSTTTPSVGAKSQPASSIQTSAPPQVDAVQQQILALVVEKTGYPPEMLDMDLDLEADLGVDTVKQAELFAGIREIYSIPRQESLRLRDFPTLKHVVKFVYDNRPDLVAQSVSASSIPTTVEPEVRVRANEAKQPETSAVPAADAITERILDLVAEKTGYPKDMLDLELDLEADLGVDTVKQAEMFASIRSIYNIPRDENLKLRDFPTLNHVIQFARDRSTIGKAAPSIEPAAPVVTAPTQKPLALASFDETNLVPRRVPVPVLRPPLALCKNTGVALGTGSRVIVMPGKDGAATQLIAKLRALDVEVLTFADIPDTATFEATVQRWLATGPIQGVYWLPSLDPESPLDKMDAEEWHEALRLRVKLLYRATRVLYEQFAAPGTFLVSAVRLGGHHGYDEHGAVAPLGGAVAGFTKTFKRERVSAVTKVVDFNVDETHDSIAEKLIAETCFDPGAVEIGYKQSQRWTIALEEQSATDGLPGISLGQDTVFVITGAAGSIVSATGSGFGRHLLSIGCGSRT